VWADRNVEADKRLKVTRLAMTELSDELSIPVENLLLPETLRKLAWKPPDPLSVETIVADLEDSGARPWQIDATAQVIHDAFVAAHQSLELPDEPVS
jgi:ribonuclease D